MLSHCAKPFTCLSDLDLIPLLLMRDLRLKRVKQLVPGHIAGK